MFSCCIFGQRKRMDKSLRRYEAQNEGYASLNLPLKSLPSDDLDGTRLKDKKKFKCSRLNFWSRFALPVQIVVIWSHIRHEVLQRGLVGGPRSHFPFNAIQIYCWICESVLIHFCRLDKSRNVSSSGGGGVFQHHVLIALPGETGPRGWISCYCTAKTQCTFHVQETLLTRRSIITRLFLASPLSHFCSLCFLPKSCSQFAAINVRF